MSDKTNKNASSLELSSPDLLAEAIRLPEFQGFIEKRYVAPPDHAAVLIRDGQIVDTFQGANFSLGGIFGALKGFFAGKHHVRIVLADLRPFSLQTPFKALTKDNVEVAAVGTLELQVDPERATNAMGLVGPTNQIGRKDVLERFRPHLDGRVIQTAVARVNADEIRTEVGFQDLIQAEVMREVERLAGDLGLIVRGVTMEWAINAVEREAMERSEMDREQSRLDAALEDLKREVERSSEATTLQLATDVDLAKLEMTSEEDLTRLAMEGELRLADAREDAERAREMAALAHEIEVLKTERVARFENEIANADHAIDFAGRQLKLRKLHKDVEILDAEVDVRLRKLKVEAEQDLARRGQRLDVDATREAHAAARENIAGLADIERAGDKHAADLRESAKDGDTRREAERIKAETEAKLAQLKAGANMTPEQILAINAGLSSDVAAVLAEQARANASGNANAMELMREMVSQATDARVASEAQARDMFRSAMDGVQGVAQGAGGGRRSSSGSNAADETECSKCGRENDLANKFCVGCGNKLRA